MIDHRAILARGLELARIGDWAEAGRLLDRAASRFPDDGLLWETIGACRHRAKDYAGACRALETAGLLVPLARRSQCILAECFSRTGHPELAGDLYRDLAGSPTCPDALLPEVAAGLGHLGLYAEALATCRELARRAPAMAEAHFGMAFYLRRLGRPPAEVLPVVARAHELAPEVALYRISLATLLDHVGRRDEARELIGHLDLDAVSCRGCLRRMTTIFRTPGPDRPAEGPRPDTDDPR